jgi:glycosyltransferase involved in cell wall biosynthesis
MKILFITPKIPYPAVDGHTKSMWGVIKYLSLLGHKIDLVCYKQNVNPEPLKSEIEKFAELNVLDVHTKNSLVGALKNMFSPFPYNLYKYKRKELAKFLEDYLQNNKVDIIHVTNSHMGWVIDIIRKLTKVPVILRQENLELMIMKRFYETQKNPLLKLYAFIQYKKFLEYEPRLCSKFDKCIMMSDEDEKQLKILNPNVKSIVIPLGIEKELLSISKGEPQPFSLVHIGSLQWYPNREGLDWFLNDIFPEVLKKYPHAKLYLYGGGVPQNFHLPENIKQNVIVKGFVEDIWKELKDKSLAVIPLRIGSGIRVKIMEMLAVGINIITTSLGKEGLEVEDGKELLVADSPGEFAEKIINFFENKFDSSQMSSTGRSFIEKKYLWENISQKFEQTYFELINNNADK